MSDSFVSMSGATHWPFDDSKVFKLTSPNRLGHLPERRPIEVKIFDYELYEGCPFHEGLWESRLRDSLSGKLSQRPQRLGHWVNRSLWFDMEGIDE